MNGASGTKPSFFDLSSFQTALQPDRLDEIRSRHEQLRDTVRSQQLAVDAARHLVYR